MILLTNNDNQYVNRIRWISILFVCISIDDFVQFYTSNGELIEFQSFPNHSCLHMLIEKDKQTKIL